MTLQESQDNNNAPYFIVRYESEIHLVRNGQVVKSNIPCTESWVVPAQFMKKSYLMAQKDNDTDVFVEDVPIILGDSWNAEDVVALAKKLGMLNGWCSIYAGIENNMLLSINGKTTLKMLNEDYLSDIEVAYQNGRNPLDVVIWAPVDEDGKQYTFTLGDLSGATLAEKNKGWVVKTGAGEFVIEVVE